MDKCVCGAAVAVDTVVPGPVGWDAHCYAGHRIYLTDLHSPPILVEDVETGLV